MKHSIEAKLLFIVPQATKPYFESSALTGTVPKVHFETEYKSVPINDIRNKLSKDKYVLDINGFEFYNFSSNMKDFYDHDEVLRVYENELRDFFINIYSAKEVHVFDYTRRSDNEIGANNPDGLRKPADRVHSDYTDLSGPQRAKDVLGEKRYNDIIKSGGRIIQLNVWKPINGPVKRSPIAFADAASITKSDLIATDQIFPDRTGEIYHIVYSDKHSWCWVSEMTDDEILLLKGWDSLDDGRVVKYTPHGAFELPGQLKTDPPRESIEARIFIVL
tara:strand:- start:5931 stop:6758 length:828 start_codon:yes stop_codon:yes gene_type:complete